MAIGPFRSGRLDWGLRAVLELQVGLQSVEEPERGPGDSEHTLYLFGATILLVLEFSQIH